MDVIIYINTIYSIFYAKNKSDFHRTLAGAEGLEPSARGFGGRIPFLYYQGFEGA